MVIDILISFLSSFMALLPAFALTQTHVWEIKWFEEEEERKRMLMRRRFLDRGLLALALFWFLISFFIIVAFLNSVSLPDQDHWVVAAVAELLKTFLLAPLAAAVAWELVFRLVQRKAPHVLRAAQPALIELLAPEKETEKAGILLWGPPPPTPSRQSQADSANLLKSGRVQEHKEFKEWARESVEVPLGRGGWGFGRASRVRIGWMTEVPRFLRRDAAVPRARCLESNKRRATTPQVRWANPSGSMSPKMTSSTTKGMGNPPPLVSRTTVHRS